MRRQHGFDGLQRQAALRVLHGILQVEILDGEVVVAELEVAARRLEARLAKRCAEVVLLRQDQLPE